MALDDKTTKSLLSSKTFWKDALLIVAACSGYAADQIGSKATIGAIVFGLFGIVIRTLTTMEISGLIKNK